MQHILAGQSAPTPQPPFVVELVRKGEEPGGHFTPDARLILNRELRTSGLLSVLPEEDLKTLLFVLTLVTPNGAVHPTAHEVGEAMGLRETQAERLLNRLATFVWNQGALLWPLAIASGATRYELSPHVVQTINALTVPAPMETVREAAGRAAVYAHSRAHYSRPRAYVEREMLRQMGHSPEEEADTEEGKARRGLAALGVARDTVERLIAQAGVEEVLKQLEWLPNRGAKKPGAYIVAAIEKRYEMPMPLKLRERAARDLEQENQEGDAGVA